MNVCTEIHMYIHIEVLMKNPFLQTYTMTQRVLQSEEGGIALIYTDAPPFKHTHHLIITFHTVYTAAHPWPVSQRSVWDLTENKIRNTKMSPQKFGEKKQQQMRQKQRNMQKIDKLYCISCAGSVVHVCPSCPLGGIFALDTKYRGKWWKYIWW